MTPIDRKVVNAKERFLARLAELSYSTDDHRLLSTLTEETASFYLFYPHLFAPAFHLRSGKILENLSTAAQFHYLGTLLTDDVFDRTNSFEHPAAAHRIHLSTLCHGEAIKIFSLLFKPTSSFWTLWNQHYCDQFRSWKRDRQPQRTLTRAQFEKLCDQKTAMGKTILDALHLLSSKRHPSAYRRLTHSHQLFYCGFQIMDDLQDFRADARNGQFNYLHSTLRRSLRRRQIQVDQDDIDTRYQHLHLTGISQKMVGRALDYYRDARHHGDGKALPLWEEVIRTKEKHAQHINRVIESRLRPLK